VCRRSELAAAKAEAAEAAQVIPVHHERNRQRSD
jgi:hypothetical protein